VNNHYQIVVLGGGESGIGAAILAKKQGLSVFVSDSVLIKETYKSQLNQYVIDFEECGHDLNSILKCDEIVKSPGIPDNIQVIKAAKENNIPVISEIEFASRFTDAKLICITGSNGKTTTTLLTHYILKTAGLNVGLAGNIGESFAKQVAENKYDIYVLEISSFQLDGIISFKPDISILLNITPDHLDRYENSFEKYTNSKFRIIENQTSKDNFIYNADDPVITRLVNDNEIAPKLFPISMKTTDIDHGAYVKNNKIEIIDNKTSIEMTLEQLALQGKHNVYNSMAAGVAAKLMDIRRDTLKQCLSDFHNVAHRLEYVSSVHGISFINDSKATNVNSTWYALEFYNKPIIWIAGGQDKGNDYSMIKDLVKEKVKAIVCLGADNSKLHQEFGDIVETIIDTSSAKEAVNNAYQLAKKGEVVLLSPACASFDLFENYEDRGNQFKNAVKEL
jgi:UDP-N-acetylmuramoylalanine--D-glutamate ligase